MRAEALAPGTKVGRYAIVEKIGQGGMGSVYRATDTQLGRAVALKVVATDLAKDPRFLERFRREGQTAAAVRHPHVLTCHEIAEHDGIIFLALELVTGGSLSDRIKQGAVGWQQAAAFGAQIARALEAIHARGIVHRDLKPANVLVDEEGRAKLSDFGLARDHTIAQALTRTGELVGTLTYMAPEQLESGKNAGPPADLYALGGTLFALVAGQPPFPGTGPDVIAKHVAIVPPRLDSVVAGVPRPLADLVAELLRKDPMQRPTAVEAAARLEAIARGATGAPRARGPAPVLALAVAGIVAWLVVPHLRRSPLELPAPPPVPITRHEPDGAPDWYRALPREKKPSVPLPRHVRFGERPNEYVNDLDGSVLVFVAGGRTWIGSDVARTSAWESPRHEVELSPFFVGKYEVTNRQFAAFVASTSHVTDAESPSSPPARQAHDLVTDYKNPEVPSAKAEILDSMYSAELSWRTPSRWPFPASADSLPVVQVSWRDAVAYAKWAGVDLPTETQWERAALGPTDRAEPRLFPWGDEPPGKRARPPANLADERLRALDPGAPWLERVFKGFDDGHATLAPVGSFPEDASPEGLVDVLGNAREWTKDSYYKAAYKDLLHVPRDPLEVRDSERPPAHVIRGSSWCSRANDCRLTARMIGEYPQSFTGFRIVRNAR